MVRLYQKFSSAIPVPFQVFCQVMPSVNEPVQMKVLVEITNILFTLCYMGEYTKNAAQDVSLIWKNRRVIEWQDSLVDKVLTI